MTSVRVILMAAMVIISSALLAQSKGEMPFTSSSAEAKKLLRQAWVAYGDAKFDEAAGHVRNALAKDPEFGMAHASIHTNDPAVREQHLKKAAGCQLSSDEKLFIEGLQVSQRKEPVRDYFESLLTKYSKDYYLHLWIMFNYNDVKRSTEIGEMIAKRNPKFAPVYNMLGYNYMEQNDLKNAEANFSKYMSLRPDLANVYDSKADYLMRVGKIADAIPLFEKAAEMGMGPSKGKAEMAKAKLKYPGPSEKDIQEIKDIIRAFSSECMKGDSDAALKNHSDQSMEIFPNQMVNVGIANIRSRLAGTFAYGSFTNLDISVKSVEGAGPIALAWGKTAGSFKPASTGKINENKGYDMFLLRKQDQGQWRILVHHWILGDDEVNAMPSEDVSAIREVINRWNSFIKPGEILSQEHIDNLAAIHSSQAVEIYPNQRSNIGIANLRTRWAGFEGLKWAAFSEITFDTYSLAPVGSEGTTRRAIAWGIGDHTFYPKGSSELSRFLFPWAMILTKEKDDQWRILVYHFFVE